MNIKGVMFSSSKCDETVFKEAVREAQAYILGRLTGKSASEPYVLSTQKKTTSPEAFYGVLIVQLE